MRVRYKLVESNVKFDLVSIPILNKFKYFFTIIFITRIGTYRFPCTILVQFFSAFFGYFNCCALCFTHFEQKMYLMRPHSEQGMSKIEHY